MFDLDSERLCLRRQPRGMVAVVSLPTATAEVALSRLPQTVTLSELGWTIVVLAAGGDFSSFNCTCAVIPAPDAWDTSGQYPRPIEDIVLEVSACDATGKTLDWGSPAQSSSTHYPVILNHYFFESPRPDDEDNQITLRLRARQQGKAASGPPTNAADQLEQTTEALAMLEGITNLVDRRAEAIDIVYNSKDATAAVAQLVKKLSAPEAAARTFVHSRISTLTEKSRKNHDKGRQWAQRDIERLSARLAKSTGPSRSDPT
jgi:hypothetical protein